MSEQIPQSTLTALRSSTDVAPRLATSGLSSPGDVAGRFASMLAGLRDGETAVAPTVSAAPGGNGQAMGLGSPMAGAEAPSEPRVGFSAVSLLMEGMPQSESTEDVTDDTPRRKRPQVADVSGQVVNTAIAAGLHSDGRWMATLLAVGPAEPATA